MPGGTLVANDGTPPLRVVLRLLADPEDKLWKRTKQTEQSLFQPEHLYISHVFIYAVKPEYVHECQLFQLRAQPPKSPRSIAILSSPNFDPLSKFLAWTALASAEAEDEALPLQYVGLR
eukprot:7181390-Lingulodinium_polyedra.AAC.1